LSTNTNRSLIPVVCLFGPTAVGKTGLLEQLFAGSGEVISADSMQVYRGMDIGTAKPDPETLTRLPHHLIDILDFTSQFNAGDFIRQADQAVRDIHSRGLLPVISGGTAFYFRNFLYGLPEIPVVPAGIRQELTERKDREGLSSLWEELGTADPVTAGRIEPGDTTRIIRALEVFLGTGRPLSSYSLPDKPRGEFRCLMLGLRRDREELYERINLRVEIMFRQGLVREFLSLLRAGARPEHPGMKGIGYSEFFYLFENGCFTIEDVKDKIRQDSRRYAKRQMTFFRSLPGVEWYHPDDIQDIRRRIESFAGKSS